MKCTPAMATKHKQQRLVVDKSNIAFTRKEDILMKNREDAFFSLRKWFIYDSTSFSFPF
jgi:hypothetical protein